MIQIWLKLIPREDARCSAPSRDRCGCGVTAGSLGQSVTHLLATLQELEHLEHLDVGLVSFRLAEALDLTTPAGRAIAGTARDFAEFERKILRERTRAGLAQARQNGKKLGEICDCGTSRR